MYAYKDDPVAYQKVVDAFRKSGDGATVADITARTALPLEKAKELIARAADEFSARLRVTESGELLYSFPGGFRSRYRGFGATMRKALRFLGQGAAVLGTLLFKAWIMVMLVGYFLVFMAIALVALVASIAVSSSGSNDNRSSSRRGGGLGGLYLASHLFDLMIRLWFYSELTKSMDRSTYGRPYSRASRPKGRPLHQAVFSFVFGDGNPNADWDSRERQSVIAYIQAHRGVISLPEFMTLTGATPIEAESRITAYCAQFGGLPEATEDGTVVYRFDALLLRADKTDRSFPGLSGPVKRLTSFSNNPGKMNRWFVALNGVNLAFGGYFLYHALTVGPILYQSQVRGSTYLYAVAQILLSSLAADPLPLITVGLGIVPLVFAALFYLIPTARRFRLAARNETVRMENLRKHAYSRIWENPAGIKASDINPAADEYRPQKTDEARERVLKEFGTYSVPDVNLAQDGSMVYVFSELVREKEALEKYRETINVGRSSLGKTIFDSHGDQVQG